MFALQDIDWISDNAAKLVMRTSQRIAATVDMLRQEIAALQCHQHLPTTVTPPSAVEWYARYGVQFPLLSLIASVATVTHMSTSPVEREFRDIRECFLAFHNLMI